MNVIKSDLESVYGVGLSRLWFMIVTAHLMSNSFILSNMFSLCRVEKRERTTEQTQEAYLFVFCKGLLLQQIPAQCSS